MTTGHLQCRSPVPGSPTYRFTHFIIDIFWRCICFCSCMCGEIFCGRPVNTQQHMMGTSMAYSTWNSLSSAGSWFFPCYCWRSFWCSLLQAVGAPQCKFRDSSSDCSSVFYSAISIGYPSRTLAVRSEFFYGNFMFRDIILLATDRVACKVPKDSKPHAGRGVGCTPGQWIATFLKICFFF